MPTFTQRDLLFFAWNAAIGLLLGALAARYPAIESGPVPPFMWLLVGMALFEGVALLTARGSGMVSTTARFIGLSIALGLYLVVSTLAR